jgi:hypothetical protein
VSGYLKENLPQSQFTWHGGACQHLTGDPQLSVTAYLWLIATVAPRILTYRV